jgi:hypothetical protein
MSARGIGGKVLKWFRCELTDAKQWVVWDDQVYDIVDVEYGVRQVSLLGPVLYLLHVSDLPLPLEIRDSDGNSGYADDTAVWVVAEYIEEVQRELQRLADAIAKNIKDNGLALNGAKTQVMTGGTKAKARDITSISINVEGAEVKPSNLFQLLGVTFDQKFTVRPYLNTLAREARFRAAAWCKWHNISHVDDCYGSLGAVYSWASWHTAFPSWHGRGGLGCRGRSRRRWHQYRLPSTTWPGPFSATGGRSTSRLWTCWRWQSSSRSISRWFEPRPWLSGTPT